MTTRKKKKQQESGGFLKKVSSLFNLDTVMFYYNLSFYFLFLKNFFYKLTLFFSSIRKLID